MYEYLNCFVQIMHKRGLSYVCGNCLQYCSIISIWSSLKDRFGIFKPILFLCTIVGLINLIVLPIITVLPFVIIQSLLSVALGR